MVRSWSVRPHFPSIDLLPGFRPWLGLVGLWLVLNLLLNADYPANAVSVAWFAPTWESCAVLCGYAMTIAWRRRVPAWVHVVSTALFVGWALFHTTDSFYRRYFNREFRAAIDASLLPEAWRLLVTTEGLASAAVEAALVVAAVATLSWLLYVVLKLLASLVACVLMKDAEQKPRKRRLRAAGLICAALAPPALLHAAAKESATPGAVERLALEVRFVLDYPEIREAARRRFASLSEQVSAPAELEVLAGRDVSLILIESYGRGAVESQQYAAAMQTALARLEGRLTERGAVTASAWLAPPTYGGGSWYAHATLTTGVKVWTPLDYALLLDSPILPLSRRMQSYGYHTINVMPGTTRVWPEGSFFGFDEHMYAWHFPYAGPWFGWGRMPDQLVLDQVRRRAANLPRPLYKEIKLVTSHAPWRAVPAVVEDWESIGDGELYHGLPGRHFDVKWSALEGAHEPYMETILYDLEVVGDYVRKFEAADALVVMLGDHQALREASLSESWDVPVYLAGPQEVVERFVAHGFSRGIHPSSQALPMEAFLPLFLRCLSHDVRTDAI